MNIFKIFIFLTISLLTLNSTSAQVDCEDYDVTVVLSLPYTQDGSPITQGSEFCVDFSTTGFNNVASINFIISFDPSVIELVTPAGPVPTNLALGSDFELFDDFTDVGYLSFLWLTTTGGGFSIGDADLFKITFRAIGDINDCSTFNFVTDPIAGPEPEVGINEDITMPAVPCDLSLLFPVPVCVACTNTNVIAANCGTTSNTGILEFSMCGGIPPYNYTVEDASGATIASGTVTMDDELVTIDNLVSGDYTIFVSDAIGTDFQITETINNTGAIDFDLVITEEPACVGSRGTIEIQNITGGTGVSSDYAIAWSNGTFGANSIRVNEGTYDVTITDETGCQAVESIKMAADSIKLEIISIDSSTCGGNDGRIEFSITGGTPFPGNLYEVFFNGPQGQINNTTLMAETGINKFFVRDMDGCVLDSVDIFVPSMGMLDVDINVDDVLCFGDSTGSVTISISDTLGFLFGVDYPVNTVLDSPQGEIITDNNGNPILGGVNTNAGSIRYFEILSPGTYYISLYSRSECSLDTFFTIGSPDEMTFTKDSINPDCSVDAGTAIVNVDGGVMPYDYTWDFDPSLNNGTASNLDEGSYSVTVTDANDCSVETSFELEGGGDLGLNIQVLQTVNCDQSVLGSAEVSVVSGLSTFDATWFDENGIVVSISAIADGLVPGTYTVEVINNDSGCMGIDSITLEEVAEFEFTSVVTNPTCWDGSDGVIKINTPTGGIEPYLYDWEDFGPIGNCVPLLGPGDYSVTISDFTGCGVDTTFTITPPIEITAVVMPDSTSCFDSCDGTATIEPSGGTITTGSYSYQWSNGDVGPIATNLCVGIYTVTVFDELDCASQAIQFQVDRPDSLEVSINPFNTIDLNCSGDSFGSIAVQAFGGTVTNDYQYTWTDNVSNTEFAENLSEGLYEITVTDDNGCTGSTFYELTTFPPLMGDIVLLSEVECFGGTAKIRMDNITGGDPNFSGEYLYSAIFSDPIPIDSCLELIAGDYNINLFESTSGAACAFTQALTISQPDQIQIFLGEDRTMTLGDSSVFITAEIFGGVGTDTIIWENDLPQDGSPDFECMDEDCLSIFIYPENSTTFTVTFIDENGCSNSESVFVDVLKERRVYRPNAFNPNSQLGNDRFMIFTGSGTEEIEEFSIYDRWGNRVFLLENLPQSEVSPDDGWDGTFNGSDAENGIYVYYARIKFLDQEEPLIYRGELTLIR